ncbi:hypothetical protein [Marisediminicola sp. LYQ85]|uniref:hypothetical protein n=1 Tax=Marisediminicola sp. LYQ85 TaxID=3391062 RepID=UPI00398364A0
MTHPAAPNPYVPNPAAPNPYVPNPYAPASLRPPLSKRHKRGAFWAGFVGLNLVSLGGSLLVSAAGVAAFVAFLSAAMDSTGSSSLPSSPDASASQDGFAEAIDSIDLWAWLTIAALVGFAVVALGVIASGLILRGRGVRKPWAVTWSSIGISLPVLVVIGFVGATVAQFVGVAASIAAFSSMTTSAAPAGSPEGDLTAALTAALATGAVGLVFSVIVVGIAGWLIWWWMTHVFRGSTAANGE